MFVFKYEHLKRSFVWMDDNILIFLPIRGRLGIGQTGGNKSLL